MLKICLKYGYDRGPTIFFYLFFLQFSNVPFNFDTVFTNMTLPALSISLSILRSLKASGCEGEGLDTLEGVELLPLAF